MKQKKHIQRWIAMALLVFLLAGLTANLVVSGRAAPENPLPEIAVDAIAQETLSGTYGGLTQEEQAELELQQQEEENQEQTPPEEPERETEEEPNPDSTPDSPTPGPSPEPSPDPAPEPVPSPNPGPDPDPTPDPGPTEPFIDTDLQSGTVYAAELENHILAFYAKAVNCGEDAFVRVRIRNDETNGVYQTVGADGDTEFSRKLAFGENYFALYLIEGGKTLQTRNIRIRYEAEQADGDHPDQGDHPLTVITNLDDARTTEGKYREEKNSSFIFQVTVTDYQGKAVQHDHMTVTLKDLELGTSQVIADYTGKDTYEYQLDFTPPNKGEYKDYTVILQAHDDAGNSAYRSYSIRYYAISEGDRIGTATIIIDATTVGLGVVDAIYQVEVKAGDKIADVVLNGLHSYDYSTVPETYAGGAFYLSSISRAGTFGGSIDETLLTLLNNDNVVLNGQMSYDSLGDTHYTNGSGWLCYYNGASIGRGMGSYDVADGSTIELRYTLAWGKDVGGTGGGAGGLFPYYCYSWVGGSVLERGHDYVTEVIEPTQTEDGRRIETCRRCGKEIIEILPATGGGTEAPELTPVPTVAGLVEAEAISALQNAGLGYAVTQTYDAAVPAGTVISQSVAAGTPVAAGTVVTLTVSLGPEPAPEPVPEPAPEPVPEPTPPETEPAAERQVCKLETLTKEMRWNPYEITAMAQRLYGTDPLAWLPGIARRRFF